MSLQRGKGWIKYCVYNFMAQPCFLGACISSYFIVIFNPGAGHPAAGATRIEINRQEALAKAFVFCMRTSKTGTIWKGVYNNNIEGSIRFSGCGKKEI